MRLKPGIVKSIGKRGMNTFLLKNLSATALAVALASPVYANTLVLTGPNYSVQATQEQQ
jgi:hypothetical protein